MSFFRIISMCVIQKLQKAAGYTKKLQIKSILLCYQDEPHAVSNEKGEIPPNAFWGLSTS